MIIIQTCVGPLEVFCYIVACPESGKGVIIDPGGEEGKIIELLHQNSITPVYIINTHYHYDHITGNSILHRKFGINIIIHKDDFPMLGEKNPASFKLVAGDDIIEFGHKSLKVIHTPGHSRGSICLYGDGNLFTGDTVFVGLAGRTDLAGGNHASLLASIKNKIAILPEETIIWPGHDYGDSITSTVGKEKRENPFFDH
jgi:glyoxylase-like metal-dependent hydrolase (beta-lactamase superfamily II)